MFPEKPSFVMSATSATHRRRRRECADERDLAQRGDAARSAAGARGRATTATASAGRPSTTGATSIAWNWSSTLAHRVVGEGGAVRARVLRAMRGPQRVARAPPLRQEPAARGSDDEARDDEPRSAAARATAARGRRGRGSGHASGRSSAAPRPSTEGRPRRPSRWRSNADEHERDEQALGVAQRGVAHVHRRERVRRRPAATPAGSRRRAAAPSRKASTTAGERARAGDEEPQVRRRARRRARTAS